ncbi:MAG TPA: class I mannose-6-phosphate isomerase [Kiritimatiellia bacterium]|nr:class I mannose-6-phosphate isomerase [Kiritimatiellia bacterium]
MHPLFLKPVYQDYLWGGERIPAHFNRSLPPGRYAEAWEVSDRPEGQGVVEDGPLAGRTLRDLVEEYGADLLGRRVAPGRFPLLIKLIDARETLSVQVHPNNENAHRTGGEPKTEMWYVLEAAPDACVYAGFKPGVTPERLRAALADNTVQDLLVRLPVKPHDALFVPGGRVHAIGAGCLLLECQQNSNTTYRLYDWGRVGADGKPRELHVEPAIQVTNWREPPPELAQPRLVARENENEIWDIVSCPFFRMQRLDLRAPHALAANPDSFRVLFVAGGECVLQQPGFTATLARGRTVLVPASCGALDVRPGPDGATIMVMDVP